MTKNSLGRRLEERGYRAIKLPGGQRAWKGLKIKNKFCDDWDEFQ